MIMGDAFGKAYQYGKRKISSMTNEEFNKLTADDLAKQLVADYTTMIPHLEQAMSASKQFQNVIVKEIAELIPTLPKQVTTGIFEGIREEAKAIIDEFGNLIPTVPQAHADTGPGSTATDVLDTSVSTINYENLSLTEISNLRRQMQKLNQTNTTEYANLTMLFNLKTKQKRDTGSVMAPSGTERQSTQKEREQIPEQMKHIAFKKEADALYQTVANTLLTYTKGGRTNDKLNRMLKHAKIYNQFVQRNARSDLTIDTKQLIKGHLVMKS